MQNNYGTIVSNFENRSTNGSAWSFNAKVKVFRNQFRGVNDIPFFTKRLSTLLRNFLNAPQGFAGNPTAS
jgi:hypothetical protein